MSSILNYVVTGSERDHVLLLIHPLGADLHFWDDFVAAIDGRMTTLVVDLRGAGSSPGSGRPVSLAEHVADIEAVRNALRVSAASAIGCAIGAMSAASYAALHPDRTRALVMVNPTPRTLPQAKDMLTARAETVRQGGMQAILPGAVERAFLNLPHDARYDFYMKRFSEQDAEAYAVALLAAAEADATEAIGKVGCPTLLVPGRHDVLLPMANAEAVQALLPQARMSVMEDAAHFVPYQQPLRLAELVLDFVGRPSAASHASERYA